MIGHLVSFYRIGTPKGFQFHTDRKYVERRREARIQTNQRVRILVLDQLTADLTAGVEGIAVELSGKGIKISLDRYLPPGAAVKLELPDSILLGEVCYCRPAGKHYEVGLQLEHALHGIADLARLSDHLLRWQPQEKPVAR